MDSIAENLTFALPENTPLDFCWGDGGEVIIQSRSRISFSMVLGIQNGLQRSSPPSMCVSVEFPSTGNQGWPVWPAEHGRSDGATSESVNSIVASTLVPWIACSEGKLGFMLWGFEQLCRHIRGTCQLVSPKSELPWKVIYQLQSRLQERTTSEDNWLDVRRDPEPPNQVTPESWPTETVRNNC